MAIKDPVGRDDDGDLAVIKRPDYFSLWHLNIGVPDIVTLNSYTITPTASNLSVLKGNTTALRTINDGMEGSVLIIRAQPGITAFRNTGNLKLKSNMSFSTQYDTLTLLKVDNYWVEIARSNN